MNGQAMEMMAETLREMNALTGLGMESEANAEWQALWAMARVVAEYEGTHAQRVIEAVCELVENSQDSRQ